MHTRFSTSHSCRDFLGFFSNFFDFFRFFWIFLPFSLTEFNGRQIKINEQNLTDRMAPVSGHLYRSVVGRVANAPGTWALAVGEAGIEVN